MRAFLLHLILALMMESRNVYEISAFSTGFHLNSKLLSHDSKVKKCSKNSDAKFVS